MASLIAGGAATKDQRTVGVAPGAIIDVVKVAGNDGATSFGAMMVGLNWVASHADTERVVNLSFGLDPGSVGGYGVDPLNLATEIVRSQGVNVVVSAGNTAGQVTDPGFDPRVITVGAADTRGWWPKLAPFSGSAVIDGVTKPDLVAAGVGLLGTLPPASAIARANPGSLQANGFYRGSGTSEATAVVSGLAAMFVSTHPDASAAQVKAALRVAANPVYANGAGAGLASVATRLAVPHDDLRMGAAGATGEATLDLSSWQNNAWGTSNWDSVRWDSVRWDSVRWDTLAFASVRWDSVRWGSVRWDSVRWDSVRWDAAAWGSVRWDADDWGSVRWDASVWGGEYWGADGGGAA